MTWLDPYSCQRCKDDCEIMSVIYIYMHMLIILTHWTWSWEYLKIHTGHEKVYMVNWSLKTSKSTEKEARKNIFCYFCRDNLHGWLWRPVLSRRRTATLLLNTEVWAKCWLGKASEERWRRRIAGLLASAQTPGCLLDNDCDLQYVPFVNRSYQ